MFWGQASIRIFCVNPRGGVGVVPPGLQGPYQIHDASICTAQLNFVVGDMPGNAQKIIAAAREAHALSAQLLLTPELAVCGYAAEDLFLRPAFRGLR